jgi:hypothetical protein
MADTIRQKIVDALLARLATIRTAAGFETNIGRSLFEWRDLEASPFAPDVELIAESDLSALNIKDKAEPAIDALVQGRHEKDLQFELEIGTNKKTETTSVAYWLRKIIGDVEKCLANHTAWITTVHVHSVSAISVNEMAVIQTGDVLGQAKLEFSIRYSNRRFDPYTTA